MKKYSHDRKGYQIQDFNTGILPSESGRAMNLGGSFVKSVFEKITIKRVDIHLHQHVHYHVNQNQIEGK